MEKMVPAAMYERLVMRVAELEKRLSEAQDRRMSGAYVVRLEGRRYQYGFRRMKAGDVMWCEIKANEAPVVAALRVRKALHRWQGMSGSKGRFVVRSKEVDGYVKVTRTS